MSTHVVATDFGGPEVLKLVEYDRPAPGAGEVSVQVRAAAVNPADHKQYSGRFGNDRSDLPIALGREAAGVVTAVGAGATGPRGPVSVGDEVITYRAFGAYADEFVVPADATIPKPDALGWEEASGLLLGGVTAVHAISVVDPEDGDTVLIHSGAGSVGAAAVQLATARGARVIATASQRNHDFLRELHAEPVAYGPGLAERVRELAPSGVDAAIDLYGDDDAVDASLALVEDRSRLVTVAAFGRARAEGFPALGGGPGADPGTELRKAARLDLADLAESGKLQVFVDTTYPLSEVRAAHERSIAGHVRGKIVLLP
ncbi:NADP-dependent oxidoreductase [Solicola gregarius]|uniref:NADP-dependent oxidoreductase n=1 Tax=Solicola gregarius TaxID=2908642 RepID=A0AA46TIE8_9ACTN|nr:NADP-dependent oxidoreductase [Solicola gregarius]UYM05720.1 NADP-dependent oxidoreductase [Solicola gregarius]